LLYSIYYYDCYSISTDEETRCISKGQRIRRFMTTRYPLSRGGKRLRIFLGDAQEWHGKPLYQAIVEVAQQQGAAGATVMRGIEGFGPEHHLSTERLLDVSENLPITIDIVDSEKRIEALLPLLEGMVQRGMMTVTLVEIVAGGRAEG
jgi:PII-like signaling protein